MRRRARGRRDAVHPGCHLPRCRGPHRDGKGREQHLHDAVDARVRVAVDDIAHRVRDEKAGDQDHQRADNDRVDIVNEMEAGGEIRGHRHCEGCRDGAEEGIRLPLVHLPRDKADDKPHQPGEEAVAQRAAEDRAKACRSKKIAEVINGRRVAAPPGERLFEPLRRHLGRGRLCADAAGERVELFHRLQIIAVEAHALHHHQGLAVGSLEAHHHAVRDGEGLALDTVSADDAAHRLLDAEGLRAAQRQMIGDARSQLSQKIIVHRHLKCLVAYPVESALILQRFPQCVKEKGTSAQRSERGCADERKLLLFWESGAILCRF